MFPRIIRIGLVVSHSLAYCRGILRGVKEFAETKPRWIFLPVAPEIRAIRTLAALDPSGIIAHIFTDRVAHFLRSLRKPLVNVSYVLPEMPVPRVGVDDIECGRLGAYHFLDRGFRHFGFVGHRDHAYSIRREAGFRQGVEAAGYQMHAYYEPKARPFDPMGRLWGVDEEILRWLVALPKPLGVFAPNDMWGLQLTEVCRQTNLRVPEDIAILSVDNDDLLCDMARPSLSSIALPTERIGFEAAAMLDRLLSRAKPPENPLLLAPLGVVTRRSSEALAIEDPDVAAAVRFIRGHGHMPMRVEHVLKAVPVSRRSLERRFRKTLQRSLLAEIRRVHVELAKKLLGDTNLAMPAVAARCGFSDAKQLCVVFQQLMRLSPTSYRRQVRCDLGA